MGSGVIVVLHSDNSFRRQPRSTVPLLPKKVIVMVLSAKKVPIEIRVKIIKDRLLKGMSYDRLEIVYRIPRERIINIVAKGFYEIVKLLEGKYKRA